MKNRLAKVNTLLQKEVGKLIREHIELPPGILVTVTHVVTSVDLRYATVYVSVLPSNRVASTVNRLKARLPFIQRSINRRLVMRPLPRLRFSFDPGEQHAAKIEKLLAAEKRFGPRSS
jgi:ribosome-binding factor A